MTMLALPGETTGHRRLVSATGRTVLWLWLLLTMVPLIFMMVTSLKPSGIAKELPPRWLFTPTLENYSSVLSGGEGTSVGFDRLLMNSVAVTAGATLLTVALAVPAAYALSLRTLRQRKALSAWIRACCTNP